MGIVSGVQGFTNASGHASRGKADPKGGSRYVRFGTPKMLGAMSHSLNSLKGGYIRDVIGDEYTVVQLDAGTLDYGSY